MAKRDKKRTLEQIEDLQEGQSEAKKKRRWRVSRRGFLIGTGVTGVGLALGWQFGLPVARRGIAESVDSGSVPGNVKVDPMVWFEILPDNSLTLYNIKVEMGQGIHTAFAQIAAEELEYPFEAINVVAASSNKGIEDGFGTGGSSSVNTLFTPLREGAATLREMLRAKAAEQWNVDVEQVVAVDGTFIESGNATNTLTYGEVVASVTDWKVPKDPPELKSKTDYQYIGRAMQRVDFEDKLTGRAVYGYDARAQGMLYGAVARPPTFNATFKGAQEADARTVKGVIDVVIQDDFAGVVATSRAAAYRGVDALNVNWNLGETYQQADIEALTDVSKDKGIEIQREGNVAKNLKTGKLVSADYRSPMAAHSHLEPQAALVDVSADKVTAQVSTQSPGLVRDEIAKLLGRKKEDVDVTATYLGGGFGRRLNVEVALEAARFSQAVGKPVHVGWNRTEEFRNGYVRPATHSQLEASLDENGKILAIKHEQASGDVAFPFFPAFLVTLFGADFGAWRGSRFHYDNIDNRQVFSHRVKLPLKTGWWRGLGLLANTFAVESFMDELAQEAGKDPLEFRVNHLANSEHGTRMKAVLEAAAQEAGWGKTLPEGHALGIACSTDVKTVCAQVAQVSIENNSIKVHKMTAAIDPGLIINPDGVTAQTQGSIVMGLSSTFFEKLSIKDSQFEAQNFDRYPLITMKETPDIKVVLLESGNEPYGMGEPPMGPVAAAVGNAVAVLTGQRLRELPLKLT